MKLSIIVPVYKVEAYLDKCVESILKQSFTDYELILVDDGSPDRCGEMCEDWAKKDARIRVIHKENGGLSDARNAGIDNARGDYIGFVDSDDYIRPDMFKILVSNLERYDADLSMCGYTDIYENGPERGRKENDDDTVYVWNRKQAIYEILLGKKLSVHAVTKIYKRRLFDQIRYPKGKISEDAYVIMDILQQTEKAVFTPRTEYYYVHRGNSINTAIYREIDKTRIEAHEKNYRFICTQYPEFQALAYERYLGAVNFVVHKMIMSDYQGPDRNELLSILRKNRYLILKSEYFSKKRKTLIFTMLLNNGLYKAVVLKLGI